MAQWSVKNTSVLILGFIWLYGLTEFSGYLRSVLLAICVMIKGNHSTFGELRQEHFPNCIFVMECVPSFPGMQTHSFGEEMTAFRVSLLVSIFDEKPLSIAVFNL